jgi:hypothetical protein
MMQTWISVTALLLGLLQTAPSFERPTVPPQAFVGTWVGTQSWNIANPPPGVSKDQPVSLTMAVVDEKLTGTMTPFMGGNDGATFVETEIVGDELRASAIFTRPPENKGARAPAPAVEDEEGAPRIVPSIIRRPTWKDTVKIRFVFKADRVDLKGTGDIEMNGVKWLHFTYDLSKKRARY